MSWPRCAGARITAFSAPMVIRVADRRISERRRDLSQPVRRSDLHAHSRPARGVSVERAGRLRIAAHGASAATIRCCFWSTSGCIASRTIARRIPGPDYTIPFGKAKVVKSRTANLTIVTYGALVQKSLQAALQVEQQHPEPDHRSDRSADALALRLGGDRTSVEKTSRVMIAHEDCLSWGYGAEICGAHRQRAVRPSLDAPVGRVAALDTWVGYHPQLEERDSAAGGDPSRGSRAAD